MRTTIQLSEDLLKKVMKESKAKTVTQAIRDALEGYLDSRKRVRLIRSFGSFKNWNPDLRRMRKSRDLD
jgi:nucleoid DNA-binding protein